MPAAIAIGVLGIWLALQATAGRLAARILSYREVRPGEVPLASTSPSSSTSSPGTTLGGAVPGQIPDTGTLSIDQVAQLVLALGLTEDQAVTAVAIAMRESGGRTDAHNPVPPDDSYGLWQINRLAHGDRLGTAEQLKTARGNAAAMLELSGHGTNWQPWQIGGNPLARTNVTAAKAAVSRARGGG